MNFNYYLPVNLIFGAGTLKNLGSEAVKYGRKALIVTGRGSTKKTGLLDRALALLMQEGLDHAVFDRVTPNPTSDTAMEGVKLLRKEGCDLVIALGGGSIIDCAKAIAFSAVNEGDIFEYIFGRKTGTQALPIIAVPTTCGTGSEGNCFAVLTDPRTKDKKSLRNMACVPKVSIVDPDLMRTMPAQVAASVMFDALCHNMEACLSGSTQPLVEAQALFAISLMGKYMVKAYQNYDDMQAWNNVTLASTLGGMNINMAGVTAPHGMEHPASGLRDIVHGRGLAALTPIIFQRSLSSSKDKFAEISVRLGGKSDKDLVDRLYAILDALSLRTTLGAEGIKKEDIEWMSQNCAKVSAPALQAHPLLFSTEEIKDIYLEAL